MTVIYRYSQPIRLYDVYRRDERSADLRAQVLYWTSAAQAGRVREPIETLGQGCTLMRHWEVDDPATAFAPWWFWSKRGNLPIPDLLPGPWYRRASERARAVFEKMDPGTHQFFPIEMAGKDGAPWSGPPYYAMVLGRSVRVEPPTPEMPMPKSDAVLAQALRRIEATPGVPTRLAEFPVWTVAHADHDLYFNPEMMAALKAADLSGLKEFTARNGSGLQSVAHVWFRELNQ